MPPKDPPTAPPATSRRPNLRPQERLIVALDVPTRDEALRMVESLGDLVSFYKVGLELLLSGGMADLLRRLVPEKSVFVDLKLPGDIPETVRRAVAVAANLGVKFLTLSNSVTSGTIRDAVRGRAGSADPKLLFVSFLSSQDRSDFAESTGRPPSDFEAYVRERTGQAGAAGTDGFIVSGPEIRLLREGHPDTLLVSPGIRPSGASTDDHKRSCTPAEAIAFGADYLVVGRPIRDAPDRRGTVQRIVDEIARAAEAPPATSAP